MGNILIAAVEWSVSKPHNESFFLNVTQPVLNRLFDPKRSLLHVFTSSTQLQGLQWSSLMWSTLVTKQ